MASNAGDKRGPRLGDAASLWNFTPSPGWTKEEANVLKLCLMKYGVGRWVQILETGLLPGKMIQQLNAYTNLQVDIDRIRADNLLKQDVQRKSGLIIWAGPNPTKRMKEEWQREARAGYGLGADALAEVDAALEEAAAAVHQVGGGETARFARLPLISLLDAPLEALSREQKLLLLKRLRAKLRSLAAALAAKQGPSSASEAAAEPDAARGAPPSGAAINKAAEKAPKRARGAPKPKAGNPPAAGRPRAAAARGSSASEDEAPPKRCRSKRAALACKDAGGAVGAEAAVLAADIAELEAMGFSAGKAREALMETSNDLAAATEWLISACL